MQETGKTSIVYALTIKDLVAYNLFAFRTSPKVREIQHRILISRTLVTFFCVLPVLWFTGLLPFWPSLGTSLLCTLWAVGCTLYYQRRGYIKRVRKLVEKQELPPGWQGEHTLEVDEDGIIVTSAYSRVQYAWGALQRIESEPGYTYIFLGGLAYIIRHDAIMSGDLPTCLEQIGRHFQSDRKLTPRLPSQPSIQ
jgi:hypothetical protein